MSDGHNCLSLLSTQKKERNFEIICFFIRCLMIEIRIVTVMMNRRCTSAEKGRGNQFQSIRLSAFEWYTRKLRANICKIQMWRIKYKVCIFVCWMKIRNFDFEEASDAFDKQKQRYCQHSKIRENWDYRKMFRSCRHNNRMRYLRSKMNKMCTLKRLQNPRISWVYVIRISLSLTCLFTLPFADCIEFLSPCSCMTIGHR